MMTRMPNTIADEATVTKSDVPMLQTASAAGFTDWLAASAPTTESPTRPRAISASAPATMKSESDRAQGAAAAGTGEVDGEAVERQHQERQDDRQVPDHLGDALGGGELIGAEDRHLAGTGRDFRSEGSADAELSADLRHQRAQVELDFAAAGRDGRVAVEDLQQRYVSGAVRLAPEFLDVRVFQRLFGDLWRQLMQAAGGGAGQRLQFGWQRTFQLSLDVDVREQLVGQVVGELAPDVLVLKQLGRWC